HSASLWLGCVAVWELRAVDLATTYRELTRLFIQAGVSAGPTCSLQPVAGVWPLCWATGKRRIATSSSPVASWKQPDRCPSARWSTTLRHSAYTKVAWPTVCAPPPWPLVPHGASLNWVHGRGYGARRSSAL